MTDAHSGSPPLEAEGRVRPGMTRSVPYSPAASLALPQTGGL